MAEVRTDSEGREPTHEPSGMETILGAYGEDDEGDRLAPLDDITLPL